MRIYTRISTTGAFEYQSTSKSEIDFTDRPFQILYDLLCRDLHGPESSQCRLEKTMPFHPLKMTVKEGLRQKKCSAKCHSPVTFSTENT